MFSTPPSLQLINENLAIRPHLWTTRQGENGFRGNPICTAAEVLPGYQSERRGIDSGYERWLDDSGEYSRRFFPKEETRLESC